MKVSIPTPLRSYTGGNGMVDAGGSTLAELLTDLERRYPGFRFRIIDEQDALRTQIRIFINEDPARDLAEKIQPSDTVHIICALSGG